MIAFTFPGQGSQQEAMGTPWSEHPSWELVGEASQIAGRDVDRLLTTAPAEELRHTRNSQLATFVLSLVVLDAVERLGVAPTRLAGHSLGEYAALVAAGALSFGDGVALVTERGDAMQSAAEEPVGSMAAVLGLDDGQVEVACLATEGDVWVANFNAPGQVVIAGAPAAIERAGEVAKKLGAKRTMALPVSGAFHTPFMAPAQERLEKAIDNAELRDTDVPVLANVDGAPHTAACDWEDLLARQLTSPVRWRSILHNLSDGGVSTIVELGPGTVLTGLAKRTVPTVTRGSVATPDDLDGLIELLAAPSTQGHADEGEGLHIAERIVVSPGAGVFSPAGGIDVGSSVEPGSVVGMVGDQEVRSPFPGELMGMLAHAGERVMTSQPIAWLRTE